MKVKGLIFDLDYTLYDMNQYVNGAHQLCIDYISEKLKIEKNYGRDRLNQTVEKHGIQYDFLFNEWLKLLDITDIQYVKECIKVFHSFDPDKLEYYDGAEDLLIHYKQKKYKIGIVTDGNSSTQIKKINLLRLDDYADAIILTDELMTSKPDEQVFLKICELLKLQPSECLFIGDNPVNDILGANKIGMKTARLLKGPFADDPNVAGIDPDITLNDINSLLNYVK